MEDEKDLKTGDAEEVEPEPKTAAEPEEGEPGGESPDAVRGRKEYRARKKLEGQMRELQVEKANLQGQLQTFQEQGKTPKGNGREAWTSETLGRAINDGKVEDTPENRLHVEQLKEQELEDRVAQRVETRVSQTSRQQEAIKGLKAYAEAYPALDDTSSEVWKSARREMEDLVSAGADPKNPIIQLQAVKAALGPLSRAKQRKDAEGHDAMTREGSPETHTGGGSPEPKTGGWKSGIPATQIEYWEGKGHSEKEQKELAAHWRQAQNFKVKR